MHCRVIDPMRSPRGAVRDPRDLESGWKRAAEYAPCSAGRPALGSEVLGSAANGHDTYRQRRGTVNVRLHPSSQEVHASTPAADNPSLLPATTGRPRTSASGRVSVGVEEAAQGASRRSEFHRWNEKLPTCAATSKPCSLPCSLALFPAPVWRSLSLLRSGASNFNVRPISLTLAVRRIQATSISGRSTVSSAGRSTKRQIEGRQVGGSQAVGKVIGSW